MSQGNNQVYTSEVRTPVEDQELEAGTTEQTVATTYTVIRYPAKDLPDQYKNMIYSKWLRSLKYGNEYFKLIDSDAYYDIYHKLIDVYLNRPNANIRLAVLTDEPDTCLGWSLVEGQTLHYVWVHKDNRKKGIANALVSGPISYITHLTNVGASIWASKRPDIKFNPFI